MRNTIQLREHMDSSRFLVRAVYFHNAIVDQPRTKVKRTLGKRTLLLVPMSRPRNDENKVEGKATTTWLFRQNGLPLVFGILGFDATLRRYRTGSNRLGLHQVREQWCSL